MRKRASILAQLLLPIQQTRRAFAVDLSPKSKRKLWFGFVVPSARREHVLWRNRDVRQTVRGIEFFHSIDSSD
jgi:hypothetical protein